MLRRLAFRGHELGVDGVTGNPRQPLAREHEREGVTLLARDARVDEDVLQLARAAAAGRPQAQAGSAIADVQLDARAEVDGVSLLAARAAPHLEPRHRSRLRLR